jgi:ADP-ribose pyrophosphatase
MKFARVGTRRLARVRFLTLERSYHLTPDGWTVRDIVRHPGSVVIVPWDGERVHLIRQHRPAVGKELLELPAGKLDIPGENSDASARRECIEEVGLDPGRLRLLHTCYTSPGFTDELTQIYLAEDLRRVPADPKGPEERAAEVTPLTLDDVRLALESNTINDATTLVGLQALLLHETR